MTAAGQALADETPRTAGLLRRIRSRKRIKSTRGASGFGIAGSEKARTPGAASGAAKEAAMRRTLAASALSLAAIVFAAQAPILADCSTETGGCCSASASCPYECTCACTKSCTGNTGVCTCSCSCGGSEPVQLGALLDSLRLAVHSNDVLRNVLRQITEQTGVNFEVPTDLAEQIVVFKNPNCEPFDKVMTDLLKTVKARWSIATADYTILVRRAE